MSPDKPPKTISRRQFMASLAASFFALAIGGAWAFGNYRFVISEHQKQLKGLKKPLKLVQLTDLHYGTYVPEKILNEWIDAALEQSPDLILITGDFVHEVMGKHTSRKPLFKALSRLRTPLGVWGVLGNHDYLDYEDVSILRTELEEAGITILKNEGTNLRDDFFLAGVDDFVQGQPDLSAALQAHQEESACLLMSHNSDLLPDVPNKVSLTLCGHTHGGQIKIPGIGAVVTSSIYGKRFVEGWVEPKAYVSRGLGFAMIPVRLNCPAEIVVMDLRPET